MTDSEALKSILHRLLLAVSGLPTAKFDNLAQWTKAVPPIAAAAETVSIALRERNPNVASILLKVAADCSAMREAIKADEEIPPTLDRIAKREAQLWEMQAAVARAIGELEARNA